MCIFLSSHSAVDGLVLVLIFFLPRSLEQFYLMLLVLGIEFTSVPDIHNKVILSMRKSYWTVTSSNTIRKLPVGVIIPFFGYASRYGELASMQAQGWAFGQFNSGARLVSGCFGSLRRAWVE